MSHDTRVQETQAEVPDGLGKWTDAQKFWAETWRTIIIGVVGAAIAFLYLDRAAKINESYTSTKMNLRSKAIEDFILTSRTYIIEAETFCADGSNDIRFKSGDVDSYRTSLERMRAYWQGHADFVTKIDTARRSSDALFAKCNHHINPAGWHDGMQALIDADSSLTSAAFIEMGKWE